MSSRRLVFYTVPGGAQSQQLTITNPGDAALKVNCVAVDAHSTPISLANEQKEGPGEAALRVSPFHISVPTGWVLPGRALTISFTFSPAQAGSFMCEYSLEITQDVHTRLEKLECVGRTSSAAPDTLALRRLDAEIAKRQVRGCAASAWPMHHSAQS